MSQTKVKPTAALAVLPPENKALTAVTEDFAEAKRYWSGTKIAAQLAIFGAVMAGIELARLKEKYGIKRGGDRGANPTQLGLAWADIVKQEMGFSDEWASRLIKLGAGMEKRVKELRQARLMERPLSDLSEAERKSIETAIKKKTGEASTITEVMKQCGVLKKSSSGGGGGSTDGGAPLKEMTLDEEARAKVWAAQHPLATLVMESKLQAWLNTLPLHPPGEHDPFTNEHDHAALAPLKEDLEKLLESVEEAIAHKKAKGKGARA